MEKTLLNSREMAKRLGISQPTLRRWRERGMPTVQIIRRIMYPVRQVEQWLADRTVSGSTQTN